MPKDQASGKTHHPSGAVEQRPHDSLNAFDLARYSSGSEILQMSHTVGPRP
jgi:aminopeptidase N